MSAAVVTMPGGLLDADEQRQREAVVRPLNGRDEQLLAGGGQTPAQLVTAVLARCVERIGRTEVTEQVARDLAVGDRQFLLLSLRQATFGPRVTAVIACPWRDCAERMDLDFGIPDIPVRSADTFCRSYQLVLSEQAADGDEDARRITFRLPTGADQEAVAGEAGAGPVAALDQLLRRCVLSVGGQPPGPEFGPRARAEIETAMHAAAFGPQLSLDAACPECGRSFSLPFDIQDFFFGEVRSTPDLLLREVHYLAYHYHWSESEILGLDRGRRQRYIEVLADELGGRGDVG